MSVLDVGGIMEVGEEVRTTSVAPPAAQPTRKCHKRCVCSCSDARAPPQMGERIAKTILNRAPPCVSRPAGDRPQVRPITLPAQGAAPTAPPTPAPQPPASSAAPAGE